MIGADLPKTVDVGVPRVRACGQSLGTFGKTGKVLGAMLTYLSRDTKIDREIATSSLIDHDQAFIASDH